MKGKLPIILSALIALVTVLGLVSALVPTVVSADIPANTIAPITMPTTSAGNLAPLTGVTALTQAVDGTMFAGVRDEDSSRWPVKANGTNQPRDYAVFYSTNGGYNWKLGFVVPWDDNSEIMEIVAVPDYSANNSIVYMATLYYVYISVDGGVTFTRTDSMVPYVGVGLNTITSLDVAANINGGGYVCVVGTDGDNAGVFTYNEGGFADWRDKQIDGQTAATPNVDTVYDVKFSPRYAADKDKVIMAVAYNNIDGATILTIRGKLGTWGVEALDATICTGTVLAARIAVPADYNWLSNPLSYIAIKGGSAPDAYRILSMQSPGSPTVTPLHVGAGSIFDIAVSGSGTSTQALVTAHNMSTDQVQVYKSLNVAGFAPAWEPSYKPPVGDAPAWLVWTTAGAFVATEFDGATISGVSKMVDGDKGMAWDGIGLLDTVVVSGTYLGDDDYVAGPVWVEASPNNKVDNTIYMATYCAEKSMYMWRTANGGTTWDLILTEDLVMPQTGIIHGTGDTVAREIKLLQNDGWLWSMQTAPAFNNSKGADQTMWLMACKSDMTPWLYKSTDAGNTWKPISAMPNIKSSNTPKLQKTAWCVVDDTTLLISDTDGYIYKTTTGGLQWTDGAPTVEGARVTDLKYYTDPTLGLVVLAGIYDETGDESCQAWISLDGGISFNQVGTSLATVPARDITALVMVAFDNNWNTNHMIYAAFGGEFTEWYYDDSAANPQDAWVKDVQDDAGLWRSSIVTSDVQSSIWKEIVSTEDFTAFLPASVYSQGTSDVTDAETYLWPTALQVGPDNTIYMPFTYMEDREGNKRITKGGFIRCIDGTANPIQWSFVDEGMPRYGGLWMASVVSGSQTMYTIGTRLDQWSDETLNEARLLVYKDTLGSKASSLLPASGATGAGTISGGKVNVPLSWGSLSGTSYQWQVAYDSTFDTIVSSGTASTNAATATGLEKGSTYYWRVRVTAPTVGPWSGAISFTTANTVSDAPQLISPANGDTINTAPAFSWSAVTGATSYKIQVAADSGFSSPTEATAATNVYASGKLSNGIYYWRVQATVGSTTTAWSSTGIFTVGAAATSSSTPAWVWVLIVLGIVLAIFVLVLILKTRRPV